MLWYWNYWKKWKFYHSDFIWFDFIISGIESLTYVKISTRQKIFIFADFVAKLLFNARMLKISPEERPKCYIFCTNDEKRHSFLQKFLKESQFAKLCSKNCDQISWNIQPWKTFWIFLTFNHSNIMRIIGKLLIFFFFWIWF